MKIWSCRAKFGWHKVADPVKMGLRNIFEGVGSDWYPPIIHGSEWIQPRKFVICVWFILNNNKV